jgi:hypothetical protein
MVAGAGGAPEKARTASVVAMAIAPAAHDVRSRNSRLVNIAAV